MLLKPQASTHHSCLSGLSRAVTSGGAHDKNNVYRPVCTYVCVCARVSVTTHTLFSNLNLRSSFPERAVCRPILQDIAAQPLSYIFSSFLSKKYSFLTIVYVHDVPVCMHGVCVEMHASQEHRQGSKDNLQESVLSFHWGVDSKA